MKVLKYSIARQFTEYPAGRYRDDGRFSGEVFREDVLVPILSTCDKLIIDLDGAMGYGSSFLEEAFGGVVRTTRFKINDLREKLEFKSEEDPDVISEIWEHIENANHTH